MLTTAIPAQVIVDYINKVKQLLSGTRLKCPVGHVDTWTAWVNSSNAAVIEACDFIGFDAYPYFQDSTPPNDVAEGLRLFDEAFEATQRACGNKPLWVSVSNARASTLDERH